ncbi:hypothetical protein APUTEX25_001192 [Auxenochlorella protothecoides]|uniref:Uncharacterized protein n=1 Tax=Auxenochlorella protothecoides TaxID=3075 RepID=A0A3M7KRC9_AUXPR|nr:hypothetical protein APUTEX25_001192 [Auxenochlorella protothecoides]|eukprot:RMZ53073.1 hypothetical protein APUTEX25_001192 [Auxenochlorella protothecoides]
MPGAGRGEARVGADGADPPQGGVVAQQAAQHISAASRRTPLPTEAVLSSHTRSQTAAASASPENCTQELCFDVSLEEGSTKERDVLLGPGQVVVGQGADLTALGIAPRQDEGGDEEDGEDMEEL